MPRNDPDQPILEAERYVGTLARGGDAAPIAFRLSAGPDFRLKFEVEPGTKELYRVAIKDRAKPGQLVTYFELSAQSESGKSITSDSVSISKSGFNDGGYHVSLKTDAATVVLPMEKCAERPLLRLWFRAFRSFRNPINETPLGSVEVWGATKRERVDDVTGYVAIRGPADFEPSTWRAKSDKLLWHMHRGLAFAHGGRLQTPRLDYIEGNVWTATFYAGSASRSEFAAQHQLNHGPFIEALIDRYFSQGALPEVLWTALGWMQSDTTFDEVRFLTAMTALETIIESELPEKRGTTLPKATFKTLRESLHASVNAHADLSPDQKEDYCLRIGGINRKSFAEKIDALFDHYGISRRDFDGDTIKRLVQLRNEIVHRGYIPDGVDAWPMIILVRELIVRILLSAIGFQGRYCCYIGGEHDRDFPDELDKQAIQTSLD